VKQRSPVKEIVCRHIGIVNKVRGVAGKRVITRRAHKHPKQTGIGEKKRTRKRLGTYLSREDEKAGAQKTQQFVERGGVLSTYLAQPTLGRTAA